MWDDNLSAPSATLQVRRTLSQTRTGHIFEKPKNGKGRSVKCAHKATEALKCHRSCQTKKGSRPALSGMTTISSSRPSRAPPRAGPTFLAATSSPS
jgi:hypothetical protein